MGVCQLNATLAETKKLVEESKDDSKSLTKLVTSLTLMFLPATFVSVSTRACTLNFGNHKLTMA